MATADELLAGLVDDSGTHEHPVIDSDTYFVIDPIKRTITNTAREKNVLMQYDHRSERFTFELPRHVEGHDMTLCNRVYVHFNNIDGDTGVEIADVAEMTDLRVNPDNPEVVISSWEITRQATQLAGILSFLVQYVCVDKDGNQTYEWHTDIFSDIEVKAGRNNSEAAVVEYTNILEQWYQRLFGAGESVAANIVNVANEQEARILDATEGQIAAIESKGAETLATIPDDYTTTYNMANKALRTRANAIVNTVEGEAISLTDASDDYLRGLRIFGKSTQVTTTGKNLWNPAEQNNVMVGTVRYAFIVEPNTTYTLGVNRDTVSGLYASYNEDMTEFFAVNYGKKSLTFMTDERTVIYVQAYSNSNAFTEADVFYFNKGDALIEEPYSGGESSPSPSYPQDIVNLGDSGSIAIDVYGGRQLLKLQSTTSTAVDLEVNGPVCKVKNLGTNRYGNAYFILKMYPGTYIFAADKFTGTMIDNGHLIKLTDNDTGTYITALTNVDYNNQFELTKITNVKVEIYAGNETVGATYEVTGLRIFAGNTLLPWEEAITPQSMSVVTSNGLPAIPVTSGGNYTDDSGQQWVSDEIDLERGVYVQRIKTVMLDGSSDEGWILYDNNAAQGMSFVYYPYNGVMSFHSSLCDKYRNVDGCWGEPYREQTGIYSDHNGVSGRYFRPPNESVDSLNAWQAWLSENPLTFVYILATPIETPLTDAEIFAFSQLHSNYPNTTIYNDAGAHMEVSYNADTKLYFNNSRGATDEQVRAAVDVYLEDPSNKTDFVNSVKPIVEIALTEAKESGEFNGEKGKDGKTPEKGVDYFTEADKSEMVEAVLAAMPDGDEVSY